MEKDAHHTAARFARKWEDAWNSGGAAAAAMLYCEDSMLVGADIAVGRSEVERLLGLIHQQGWTKIRIKLVAAREVGGVVVAVSEFTAIGSGPTEGKTLNGKSTHVLTLAGDKWLSAMHTAV